MNNLFEFSSEMREKIKSWAKNVLSEMKSAFQLGTQNSQIKEEVGKYLALDTASGLAENSKWVTKAFGEMLEKLKYKRTLDLISEEEYYTELEHLRDKYFSKGTQNWVKYTNEIYQYQKKTLEEERQNVVSVYDDISRYASDRLTEVLNKQADFAEKIKNAGGSFDKNTVTINGNREEYYSMRNLREDIDRIKQYQSLIEEFSERSERLGITAETKKDFLSELSKEDFYASIGILNSIKGSTDEALFEYFSAWNERNALAEAVAAKSFEAEFNESVEDAYENMKQTLIRAGYEIPEGFFVSGSLSAKKFGEAFIEEIETQMERIRAVISEYSSEISMYPKLTEGVTYNTSNTSYNIQSAGADDTVEQIRRYETVKRLAGIA